MLFDIINVCFRDNVNSTAKDLLGEIVHIMLSKDSENFGKCLTYIIYVYVQTKQTNSVALSPQANYTD
jgi:hypothetical protein